MFGTNTKDKKEVISNASRNRRAAAALIGVVGTGLGIGHLANMSVIPQPAPPEQTQEQKDAITKDGNFMVKHDGELVELGTDVKSIDVDPTTEAGVISATSDEAPRFRDPSLDTQADTVAVVGQDQVLGQPK